jgi:DNA recombination protein RmuC
MNDLIIVVAALGIGILAGVLAVVAFGRRRADAEAGFVLIQQQLDALRGQMGQSLETSARSVGDRTDSLHSQMSVRLDEVTRQVNERLAEGAATMQRINDSIGQRLDTNLRMVGERFNETSTLVTSVREKLSGLEEAATKIFEVGKDLSSLQDILRPPKMRGGVGEVLLEGLLRDRLPIAKYAMQHRFRNGTIVDAVIRLEDRLVPIDSKFPIEGFQAALKASSDEERARLRREFLRGVQGHIKSIADKYIVPDEGTFDFALMYIPAENVYYEAIVRGDDAGSVYTFAMERRVIPVSPTTFYAYLMALVYGLKGLQVEKQAAQIRAGLAQLAASFERVREPLDRLGEQIRRSQKNYDDASRAFERFGDRLQGISGMSLPEHQPQELQLGGVDPVGTRTGLPEVPRPSPTPSPTGFSPPVRR